MKKYYCKDGQVVLVKPHPNDSKKIIVVYNNKKYCRSKNIIDKTIFSQDPTRVGYNNTVILTDPNTNKILLKVKYVKRKEKAPTKGVAVHIMVPVLKSSKLSKMQEMQMKLK